MSCFSERQVHIPVLISSIIDKVSPIGGVWVDGTFGAGGYTEAILEAGATYVIGIDRDPEVKSHAERALKKNSGRFSYVCDTFSNLCKISNRLGFKKVRGVILDLGVSSMQLDKASRGFSFKWRN